MKPKRAKLTRFQWNAIVDVHECKGTMQVFDQRRFGVFGQLMGLGLLTLASIHSGGYRASFTAKGRALMRRQHGGAP